MSHKIGHNIGVEQKSHRHTSTGAAGEYGERLIIESIPPKSLLVILATLPTGAGARDQCLGRQRSDHRLGRKPVATALQRETCM
jgi:hypothetical protein